MGNYSKEKKAAVIEPGEATHSLTRIDTVKSSGSLMQSDCIRGYPVEDLQIGTSFIFRNVDVSKDGQYRITSPVKVIIGDTFKTKTGSVYLLQKLEL